jgi:hypothetical protein
MGTERQNC